MFLTILLAQAGEAAVQLDGPETGLYIWVTTLTVVFGTILTRLWARLSANERVQSLASIVSPKYTTKAKDYAAAVDGFVKKLAAKEVPEEQIQSIAASLATRSMSLMSGEE